MKFSKKYQELMESEELKDEDIVINQELIDQILKEIDREISSGEEGLEESKLNIPVIVTALSLFFSGVSMEEASAKTGVSKNTISLLSKVSAIKKKFDNYSKISEEDAIARTLYAEARGEGEEGIKHVASVIYNVSKDRGTSFKNVVTKPLQYSSWNEGAPKAGSDNDPIYKLCKKIAKEMVDKTFKPVNTYHHFYNMEGRGAKVPYWARGKNAKKIGKHYFLGKVD